MVGIDKFLLSKYYLNWDWVNGVGSILVVDFKNCKILKCYIFCFNLYILIFYYIKYIFFSYIFERFDKEEK